MQIARPPSGFHLTEKPRVRETLKALEDDCPWLEPVYANAVARLRMSGHKEGVHSGKVPGLRSVVEIDPATGKRRLGISYRVLGDELTIFAIRVLAFDDGID